MSQPMICPDCRQADQVEKVSTIYVLGVEKKWRARNTRAPTDDPAPPARSALVEAMAPEALQALTRRLAPPAAKKEVPMRSIHPDLVVLTLSLVAPIFLYNIAFTQLNMLPLALAVLACFYGYYFWQRNTILARFQAQQDAQQAAAKRIQRGIQRWMKLYYCAREDGVFEPGNEALTPADQIAGYLFKE